MQRPIRTDDETRYAALAKCHRLISGKRRALTRQSLEENVADTGSIDIAADVLHLAIVSFAKVRCIDASHRSSLFSQPIQVRNHGNLHNVHSTHH